MKLNTPQTTRHVPHLPPTVLVSLNNQGIENLENEVVNRFHKVIFLSIRWRNIHTNLAVRNTYLFILHSIDLYRYGTSHLYS
jgi:hypothetical protein